MQSGQLPQEPSRSPQGPGSSPPAEVGPGTPWDGSRGPVRGDWVSETENPLEKWWHIRCSEIWEVRKRNLP